MPAVANLFEKEPEGWFGKLIVQGERMRKGAESDGIWLSICVPTYNRAALLGEMLETVRSQYVAGVEVVIVDGGSDDETKEVVARYSEGIPRITYYRRYKRAGVDIDIAKSVELATGQYCWLMSDDDGLSEGSIQSLKEILRSHHEIYICNRIVCDVSLRPMRASNWLSGEQEMRIFRLSERDELIRYLSSAREFGAIFSYMSALVVRRDAWIKQPWREDFGKSGFGHVVRIFDIIGDGGVLEYIPKYLVLNRSFNDSFLEMGVIGRFLIDVNGYLAIARDVFPNDEEARSELLRVMTLEHPWYHLLKIRANVADSSEWISLRRKILQCGYKRTTVELCGWAGKFKGFVSMAVRQKERYSRCPIHAALFRVRYGNRHAMRNLFPHSFRIIC
jgi:abequosyltransferase